MSSLWFNIRFGEWHLQIGHDRPFASFTHNAYQAQLRADDPAWRWFEVFEAPWK